MYLESDENSVLYLCRTLTALTTAWIVCHNNVIQISTLTAHLEFISQKERYLDSLGILSCCPVRCSILSVLPGKNGLDIFCKAGCCSVEGVPRSMAQEWLHRVHWFHKYQCWVDEYEL